MVVLCPVFHNSLLKPFGSMGLFGVIVKICCAQVGERECVQVCRLITGQEQTRPNLVCYFIT